MTPMNYKLNFRHLTPDAREVGVRHADSELPSVDAVRLREILLAMEKAVAQQAPADPAAPEIRITSPHGVFMVKASNGRLRLHSWNLKSGTREMTVEEILTTVGDLSATGRALSEALQMDANAVAKMGQSAAEFIHSHFTIERVADAHEEALKRLVTTGSL